MAHDREDIEIGKGRPSLVERGLAFGRALRATANWPVAKPADKRFIDSLYGEP
jgi:antitoxin VapB